METIILKNTGILTMNDGSEVRHGDLWISDGKIRKIFFYDESEKQADSSRDPGTDISEPRILDCTGCTVIPGLIDSHVHYDEGYMGDFFLTSGITSVRNMRGFEGHARWRDEILEGKRRGPYI